MGTNSCAASIHDKLEVAGLSTVRVRAVVVDDSPDIATIATEFLESDSNVDVIATAADGAEGVSTVAMFDPDLVLMDVNMPKLNGLVAVLRIKELGSHAKIILMSSEDSPDLGLAALDCGADGFIVKSRLVRELPFHLHRLFPSRGLWRMASPDVSFV